MSYLKQELVLDDSIEPGECDACKQSKRGICRACASIKTKPNDQQFKDIRWKEERIKSLRNRWKRANIWTKEELEAILKRAVDATHCEICHTELWFEGGKKAHQVMHIDHCHKTNKFRGIICGRCNFALGFLYDNAEAAKRMVRYLEDPPGIGGWIGQKPGCESPK